MKKLTPNELGIASSMIQDFYKNRLPRLFDIRARVNAGEVLSDFDIDYLNSTFRQSRGSSAFAETYPEYRKLVSQVLNLYNQITTVALENERL